MAALDFNKLTPAQRAVLLQRALGDMDDATVDTVVNMAASARRARAALAREDVNEFIPYVLRDEGTGQPITQAPYHAEIQNLCNDNKRVVLWGHVELGKTQQISVGRPLFELGKNPDLRIVIVQATLTQASKIARTIAEHIQKNKHLHEVFPDLKPAKGGPWNNSQLTVDRSPGISQPSVQVIGAHGNILGSRIDLLILDDILTLENTRSDALRKDILHWIKSTLLGRLTQHARVIFLGNAWHPQDAMHMLAAEGWPNKRFPVRDPETGRSNWPERWPESRIEEKAAEFGPTEAARQLDCLARSDDAARFKREWVDRCLDRGKGLTLLPRYEPGESEYTYTGVDLGVKKGANHDYTVLFTLLLDAKTGDRRVLNVDAGKWASHEIIDNIIRTQKRYRSTVLVESVAAQDYIVQMLKHINARLPVYPFITRGQGSYGNKNHPQYGVEGIAAEMAAASWIIPCGEDGSVDAQVALWIEEMLYYDPLGHSGDRLMASWFAREGTRRRFTYRVDMLDYDQPAVTSSPVPSLAKMTQAEQDKFVADELWDGLGIEHGIF